MWLAQVGGCSAVIITEIPYFNFIFGSCWLFIHIAEDITKDMTVFNGTAYTAKKLNKSEKVDLMKRFYMIIRCYSNAKQ